MRASISDSVRTGAAAAAAAAAAVRDLLPCLPPLCAPAAEGAFATAEEQPRGVQAGEVSLEVDSSTRQEAEEPDSGGGGGNPLTSWAAICIYVVVPVVLMFVAYRIYMSRRGQTGCCGRPILTYRIPTPFGDIALRVPKKPTLSARSPHRVMASVNTPSVPKRALPGTEAEPSLESLEPADAPVENPGQTAAEAAV